MHADVYAICLFCRALFASLAIHSYVTVAEPLEAKEHNRSWASSDTGHLGSVAVDGGLNASASLGMQPWVLSMAKVSRFTGDLDLETSTGPIRPPPGGNEALLIWQVHLNPHGGHTGGAHPFPAIRWHATC